MAVDAWPLLLTSMLSRKTEQLYGAKGLSKPESAQVTANAEALGADRGERPLAGRLGAPFDEKLLESTVRLQLERRAFTACEVAMGDRDARLAVASAAAAVSPAVGSHRALRVKPQDCSVKVELYAVIARAPAGYPPTLS